MAPGSGYWISVTRAITLHYPLTGISETLSVTTTRNARLRLNPVRLAEWEAGVQPTYEWMNFYGKLALPDGTGVPTGTIVLALDPQGAICGATATWEPGQYGLLACYADDPNTPADEGAVPGDTIRLVVGEGAAGAWQLGCRRRDWTSRRAQQVPAGPPPELRTGLTCRCCSRGDGVTRGRNPRRSLRQACKCDFPGPTTGVGESRTFEVWQPREVFFTQGA
jgi:hypothetical protein